MRAGAQLSFCLIARTRSIAIALLLFSARCAISGEFISILPRGEAEGKQFNFKLTHADVRYTPLWSPNAPNPPLSPRRAEEIARKQLEQFVVEPGRWQLTEIRLINFGDNHWAYVVSFHGQYPSEVAGFFEIPVLMNASVVEPEVKSLPR
jgi:hypothetical protein